MRGLYVYQTVSSTTGGLCAAVFPRSLINNNSDNFFPISTSTFHHVQVSVASYDFDTTIPWDDIFRTPQATTVSAFYQPILHVKLSRYVDHRTFRSRRIGLEGRQGATGKRSPLFLPMGVWD